MSVDHESIFSFISASALLGVHEKPKPKRTKKIAPASPVKKPEASPEDDPAESTSVSDDVAETLTPTLSNLSSSMIENRPLKSILKHSSSYGPEGAKNPKSLRRGFQSMMEFPTSLPEDSACNDISKLDLNAHAETPLEEEEEDDNDEFYLSRPILPRSVSFSEAEEKIELSRNTEQDKTDLWFQKHEIGGFVQNEMSRRKTLGIESTNMLCAQAHSIDDEEVFKRRVAANMPKGVRR